jgi:hypothetical protein
MNNQQIQGCKALTENVLEYLDEFIRNAISRSSNIQCVKSIAHDLNVMNEFIGQESPDWIKNLIGLCARGQTDPNTTQEIIKLRSAIEYFSWEDFYNDDGDIDKLDYDKIFTEEANKNGLNEALDRLVECLEIIKNESQFNFSKQTRIDIETLIIGLKKSKGKSESSIKTWVESVWALIKTCIPHADKIEALNKLLSDTQHAYNDVSFKIIEAKNMVIAKIQNEFCNQKLLPKFEEAKQIANNNSE